MKQVTKKEFQKIIYPQDVIVSAHFFERSTRMYTKFTLRRTDKEIGRIVESPTIGEDKLYYLID